MVSCHVLESLPPLEGRRDLLVASQSVLDLTDASTR